MTVRSPTLLDSWLDWLFANDENLRVRVIGLIATAIVLWRALWLASQPRPAPRNSLPATETSATPESRRSWWPTKQEKIQTAIDLVASETNLLLQKTAEIQASAGLEQARAQLNKLMAELKPPPVSQSTCEAPALTLPEIEALLDLADIALDTRVRLGALLRACLDEKEKAT